MWTAFTARCALNSYMKQTRVSPKGCAAHLMMGGELEVLLYAFSTSALEGDKQSVLRTRRINPEGNSPVSVGWYVRWAENGVGPGVEVGEDEEIKLP
jgi:hypothetical protein